MPLTPQTILHLQRSIGNAAVTRLIEDQRQQAHSRADSNEHSQPAQRSAVSDVLRSPGRPLDDNTRTEMETRLDTDFSDVRLHTDTDAQASAAEIGAHAYTSGSHVVIGDGDADKHTLAHELTHVIQQRRGPVAGTDNGNGFKVSDPSDRFEREAEANASRVMGAPMSEQQHVASEAGGRVNPNAQTPGDPSGGTLTRAASGTQSELVAQRMTLDTFHTQVSNAFNAQAQEDAAQHAGTWSSEQWLSRFRQWFAVRVGTPNENLDSHITETVTTEELATAISDFRGEGREFAHVEKMSELEGSFKWDGPIFAPGKPGAGMSMNTRKDFWKWLMNDGPAPAKMNCWEAVLYAAERESLIDKDYIKKAIPRNDLGPPRFAQKILESPRDVLTPETGQSSVEAEAIPNIPKGDVVIFAKDAQHVALSTGDGIYELDKGTSGITKTTIQDAIHQKDNYAKQVTWGRLPNL